VSRDEPAAAQQPRIAFPLWKIGFALAALGFLTRRRLLMLAGVGLFFADGEAEAVQRVRRALADA
jgi:hypothetical protein